MSRRASHRLGEGRVRSEGVSHHLPSRPFWSHRPATFLSVENGRRPWEGPSVNAQVSTRCRELAGRLCTKNLLHSSGAGPPRAEQGSLCPHRQLFSGSWSDVLSVPSHSEDAKTILGFLHKDSSHYMELYISYLRASQRSISTAKHGHECL